MMIPMMLASNRRRIFVSRSFEIAVELDVLLGRFSPPSRFEPRERQRRPGQDGDDDDGADDEPGPALLEFVGALLPIHEQKALVVHHQVDLQSDIVHAADHRQRRQPGRGPPS